MYIYNIRIVYIAQVYVCSSVHLYKHTEDCVRYACV